jgi:hypothetical protein
MKTYHLGREREALGLEAAREVRHRGGNARRCSAGGMSAVTTLTTAFLSSPLAAAEAFPKEALGRGAALREQRPDDAGRGLLELPHFPSLGSAPLSARRKV